MYWSHSCEAKEPNAPWPLFPLLHTRGGLSDSVLLSTSFLDLTEEQIRQGLWRQQKVSVKQKLVPNAVLIWILALQFPQQETALCLERVLGAKNPDAPKVFLYDLYPRQQTVLPIDYLKVSHRRHSGID